MINKVKGINYEKKNVLHKFMVNSTDFDIVFGDNKAG